jgi:hypothetical protein
MKIGSTYSQIQSNQLLTLEYSMSIGSSVVGWPSMLPPNSVAVAAGPPFAVGAHGQVPRNLNILALGNHATEPPPLSLSVSLLLFLVSYIEDS